MARAANCPFCDIVNGHATATVVREWDDALCIVPLNPVVDGHVLVLPKVHVETFFSSPDVSAATMRRAAELLHGVERHHEPRDHNIITSAGRMATQTVMHLHVHIVPREHGDGLPLPWTPQQEVSERAEAAECDSTLQEGLHLYRCEELGEHEVHRGSFHSRVREWVKGWYRDALSGDRPPERRLGPAS